MIQGISPGTNIQGVAVGQEGLAAQILDDIHEDTGIAGAQVGHIAQFAEVDLDSHEFILEIDLVDAGGQNQPCQLLGEGFGCSGAEVGEIYLGCHEGYLLY